MRSPAPAALLAVLLAACAGSDGASRGTLPGGATMPPRDSPTVGLAALADPGTLVEGTDAATMAIAASQRLFAWAPTVVVDATAGDRVDEAAAAGAELGVPTLVADGAGSFAAEVDRLGARAVLAVGQLSKPDVEALGDDVDVVTSAEDLPDIEPAEPIPGMAAITVAGDTANAAAVASARAAGMRVFELERGDPRLPGPARDELVAMAPQQVVAIGTTRRFASAASIVGLVRTAAAGRELPGGGQVLFPGRRLIALYGHPGDPNLGVLGEQGPEASVERARQLAAGYEGLDPLPAVPALEIITTVASSEAGADGDYSLISPLDHIRPYVEAAGAAGQYVILDLQPGTTDFLTQARLYEEFLKLPHVGLALDPEWRLAPGERHMVDIGQVGADEVNAVASWLAIITRDNALPQKLLLLHQFRTDMLPDRQRIHVHPELALVVQMDGNGTQPMKLDTWSKLLPGGPQGIHFGWKNFYDEDSPVRSPADTVALQPSPVLVSYQ